VFQECEDLGGFLVELLSREQEGLLVSLIHMEEQITGPLSWWIGLTDIMQEDR
jgi:hypothetical protein